MTDRAPRSTAGQRPRRRAAQNLWGDTPAEPQLNRGEIVRASLDLLADQGYEAFSMRKLATTLDVKNPSLYWHVQSKDDLFDLVADAIVGDCRLPEPGGPEEWSEQLAEVARNFRTAILGHSAATPLLTGRPLLGPHGLRLADHVIGTMRRAGFDDRTAGYGYLLLTYYVIGFVSQETAFGPGEVGEARLQFMQQALSELSDETFPNIAAIRDTLMERGLDDRFELGLRGLLKGLAEELHKA
ncbi:TetR/AcrR family transcriptional regulator C-terminal domain-containing protein [Streptomyces sp. NPDC001668]|uniref:TetR/AcrR family transcriptional regulator C-terminal domain-containing protein n=1 Tax=unclassified Streptomyces TaxID=2593676 RepID=UPI0033EB6DB4